MNRPWFDPATGLLLLDIYVAELQSYQKILADGVVTDAEVVEQGRRVVDLLARLEGMLSAEAQALATEALCELAALYALERAQARHAQS